MLYTVIEIVCVYCCALLIQLKVGRDMGSMNTSMRKAVGLSDGLTWVTI